MVCAPGPDLGGKRPPPADAFAFSADSGAMSRAVENVTVLWTAPWRAFWAVTLEALEPSNYRR